MKRTDAGFAVFPFILDMYPSLEHGEMRLELVWSGGGEGHRPGAPHVMTPEPSLLNRRFQVRYISPGEVEVFVVV